MKTRKVVQKNFPMLSPIMNNIHYYTWIFLSFFLQLKQSKDKHSLHHFYKNKNTLILIAHGITIILSSQKYKNNAQFSIHLITERSHLSLAQLQIVQFILTVLLTIVSHKTLNCKTLVDSHIYSCKISCKFHQNSPTFILNTKKNCHWNLTTDKFKV